MAAFNGFSAPVPGQALTMKPGSAPWQHPPKFVDLDKAVNFVFNRLMNEATLHQLFNFFKEGVSVEAIARIILFTGFSQGLWTPDLAMLMSRPVMYILSGIASRAGIKAKLTHVDRTGLKQLVGFKKMQMSVMKPGDTEPPQALKLQLQALSQQQQQDQPKMGLMAPETE